MQSAIERTGAPPTRAEIANELGFRSANAAEEHLQALARKGVIELIGGTSRGIRLQSDTLRALNQARGKQFSLPLPSLAQLSLPLIGRVAAGSPILAQEHVDRTYLMESSMFARKPDYLLKVRGMSMRDAGIMDGDLLAVQKAHEAKNGQIVVARLGDDVTVKRFRRTRSAIELLPENPDFETIHRQRRRPVRDRRAGRRPHPQQHAHVRRCCSKRTTVVIKSPKARTAAECLELEQLPNVGPALAADLRLIGVQRPADLLGRDAFLALPNAVRGHGPAARPVRARHLHGRHRFHGRAPSRRPGGNTPPRARPRSARSDARPARPHGL